MIKKEITLTSAHHNRPFGIDYRYIASDSKKPIILFIHGFKGFKDAMHFNLLADEFAKAGFIYCKINLSHNGTTPEHPVDFVDLEAFANNNFSIELDDIELVIDKVQNEQLDIPQGEIKNDEIYLIGHSRGGSVSVLKACEDARIKKLVTWAAVPDLKAFWSEDFLVKWKEEGVQYIQNARTKQNMPLNYQMVQDFEANGDRFQISKQLEKLNTPYLAIHGGQDETVAVESLMMLRNFNPKIETQIIADATHTFGGKHPWEEKELPIHAKDVLNRTLSFFKS